jgi:hypothetical protein
MRDERDLSLCLDPEHARQNGHPLLSANHPLVRAALRTPGSAQARFSAITVSEPSLPDGRYLVMLALAQWVGLRPATEFWSSAVDLVTGTLVDADVGGAVLAALAESLISPGDLDPAEDLSGALRVADRALRQRQDRESSRQLATNEALIESRRISMRESHARKVAQIDRRIATLRQRGMTGVIHLHEAQRSNQDQRLREAEDHLEQSRAAGMNVETIAVCVVEVDGRE